MANLKGINPANSGDANARAVEANVHRLGRNPSIANELPGTAEAEMPRPEGRKPEVLPPGEPRGAPATAAGPVCPSITTTTWRRQSERSFGYQSPGPVVAAGVSGGLTGPGPSRGIQGRTGMGWSNSTLTPLGVC